MSFSVALIEALEAEGMDAATIIRVLKSADKKRDNTNAERQARHRAKKARNAVTVTRDGVSNERDNLTFPVKEKPKPNGLVKNPERGSRLPDDWEPKPLIGKAAEMVAAWKAGELERELAKFKNYWPSKGANAARTDWQRTWVNWLISADERKPRHERNGEDPTTAAVRRIIGGIGAHA